MALEGDTLYEYLLNPVRGTVPEGQLSLIEGCTLSMVHSYPYPSHIAAPKLLLGLVAFVYRPSREGSTFLCHSFNQRSEIKSLSPIVLISSFLIIVGFSGFSFYDT